MSRAAPHHRQTVPNVRRDDCYNEMQGQTDGEMGNSAVIDVYVAHESDDHAESHAFPNTSTSTLSRQSFQPW